MNQKTKYTPAPASAQPSQHCSSTRWPPMQEHGPIREGRTSGNTISETAPTPQTAGTGSIPTRTAWKNATTLIKGQLLAGTRTPDGFQVDSDGRWTVNGMVKQRETPLEDLTTGIHETADGLIYRNESGELTKNGWQNANNNWYYFDSDGYAVKGWQYIDGYKFYFDETSCSLIQDLEGILAAPSFRITVDRSAARLPYMHRMETTVTLSRTAPLSAPRKIEHSDSGRNL